MTETEKLRPLKEAARITKMLDAVFGEDRFERGPVDVSGLSLEYSKAIDPHSPIHEVVEKRLPGCVGALVYSDTHPPQWAIMYNEGQSMGRRAFTIGHEFGHYILHRKLIESDSSFDHGIYCDENSILRRDGIGIESEADQFAAALLMPLHDFRRQLPTREKPNFERLGKLARRYGVSLTAIVLRWLECTETRALMIVSNEGFAHWARSSDAALKSGRFIRTKNVVYELPATAVAATHEFSDSALSGISIPAGVWFPEPTIEMCFRSERYDQEITLLHFEDSGPWLQAEEEELDVHEKFVGIH